MAEYKISQKVIVIDNIILNISQYKKATNTIAMYKCGIITQLKFYFLDLPLRLLALATVLCGVPGVNRAPALADPPKVKVCC